MRRSCVLCLLFASVFASSCATQPATAPRISLDESTGTTLSALPTPLQLLATAPGAPRGDPFAFAAPFETNRMGQRQIYLWVAVPGEDPAPPSPLLQLDGVAFPVPRVSSDPAALGIAALPYSAPEGWSQVYVYALDVAALHRLESAQHLTVDMQYQRAGAQQFTGAADHAGAVAQFRISLGLPD